MLVRLGPGGSDDLARQVAWQLGRSRTPDVAPNAAHGYRLFAIAVTEHDGAPLVISAGQDRVGSRVTIGSWRLDGAPGPLDRSFKPRWIQDSRWIGELTVVEHGGVWRTHQGTRA